MVLRRDATAPWTVADLAALRARFTTPEEQATVLGLTAVKLIALRMLEPARKLLDEAILLNPRSPDVCNSLALLHMARGEWVPALKAAERALREDSDFLPALAARRRFFSPAGITRERMTSPSSSSHAGQMTQGCFFTTRRLRMRRTRIVRKRDAAELIALAEANGHARNGYRLYLAQAHAAAGEAQPSIEQFQRVLADATISKEQRVFAEETLAQIRSRSGL
jgi:tetratricopeptide (TPR) repeat protein